MIVSLNEVEMTALKAARGAGYSWGLAEEAGKAVRWLAEREERDFGWLAPLLAILQAPPASLHCPIARGAALADDPETALPAGMTELGVIHAPGLLLPFVAAAARTLREPLLLVCHGLRFRTTPDEDAFECRGWHALAQPAAVAITRGGPMPLLRQLRRKDGGVSTSVEFWRFLDPYVVRTYVPESDTSRLTGAGAGLNDND